MRNYNKVKALERLYAELGKYEADVAMGAPYGTVTYTINLFCQDLPHILDVLAEAINKERQ